MQTIMLGLQALTTDEAFVRVAKRVYALHAFHPTLLSTFVHANNSKRARKDTTQQATDAEPEADTLRQQLPHPLPQQQPQQQEPHRAAYQPNGSHASHLTANGHFVGAHPTQPDFDGIPWEKGRKVWMDISEPHFDDLGRFVPGQNGAHRAQPAMTLLDKVRLSA